MTLKITTKKLSQPHFSPFLNDYLADTGTARRFFHHPPTPEGIKASIVSCQKNRPPFSAEFAKQLWAFNQSLGAAETTKNNIFALQDQSTVVVATGQQPGLLTGSLLTIYKVIQAICLSAKLKNQNGINCVPLFWTASNDHQHSEVDNFTILASDRSKRQIKIDIDQPVNTPFYLIKAKEEFLSTINEALIKMTPSTEFKETVLKLLEDTFSVASSLADWFNLILGRLFFKYGLIIFDPVKLPVAYYAQDLFQAMLEKPMLLHQLTEKGGERLVAAGYRVQVPPKTAKFPFFVLEQEERHEVTYFDDSAFIGEKAVPLTELAKIIKNEPQRISPNVFLRPLLQQALFPVAVFLGGPGEVAYHAQLQEAYAQWELSPPVIYPRWQIFIEEPAVRRLIKRYQLDWEQITSEPHRIVYSVIKQNQGVQIEQNWQEWTEVMHNHLQGLPQIMGGSLPLWQKKVEKFRKNVEAEWQKLYEQGWAEFKKREAKTFTDLEFVHIAHFPENKPAERVYNVFPLLIKYGMSFVDEFVEVLQPCDSGAYLIRMGDKK